MCLMSDDPKNFDLVALIDDWPQEGLHRGQVGTVLDVYHNACEVEFSDRDGRTYALLAVPTEKLLVLHFEPAQAA